MIHPNKKPKTYRCIGNALASSLNFSAWSSLPVSLYTKSATWSTDQLLTWLWFTSKRPGSSLAWCSQHSGWSLEGRLMADDWNTDSCMLACNELPSSQTDRNTNTGLSQKIKIFFFFNIIIQNTNNFRKLVGLKKRWHEY